MPLNPVVRYMLLCEDCRGDPDNPRHVDILGLLTNIRSLDDPPYPLLYRELCVYVALTECRGEGLARIVCTWEDSGQPVFASPERNLVVGEDPLEVVQVLFRMQACPFPGPGLYSVQLWYNEEMIEECLLRLR
jgi:hypothetical protein